MKILFLIQKPQLRGAEIFACQLAAWLQKDGHTVQVVSLLDGAAHLPFQPIKRLGRRQSRRVLDWGGWKALNGEIREFQPDIVQANAGDTLKYAALSKFFFRWRVPLFFRNANQISRFLTSGPKRWFNRFLISQLNHVVSVSELCRQDFIRTFSYPENRISTIPIGIDFKGASSAIPPDLAGLFSQGPVIVHVASLVPEKNPLGLVRMFAQIRREAGPIKLLIVGDGRLRGPLEKYVKELQLQEHVLLAGYRTDVLSILAHAQVFVLPSLIEGLPGVILEAMYCRTPVVAYDVGGISEVVKNRETGWLVKAGDEAGFIQAVKEALAAEGTGSITEKAYQLVVRNFDNQTIARRFEQVYSRMVS